MAQTKKIGQAIVAIVGEPNVGKSTLMNRLISERAALTSEVSGTTRDRFYAPTVWNGIDFTLVDTAGIILEKRDELERNTQKQVDIAIQEADLILYVLDGKHDKETIDRNILNKLRKQKKDVLLLINKVDSPKKIDQTIAEYQFTGFKKIFALSAVSGVGIGDMLDGITDSLKAQGFSSFEADKSRISVSIIGKPNVGKSSLFNSIIGEERVVVSDVPGTTRNVIDTNITYKDQVIKFVDTAGLKRKEKRAPLPDIYAAFQTMRMIYKSDMCIFVIDGAIGITQQDQRIASEVVEAGRGLIVAVNKTDLLSEKQIEDLERNMEHFFPFLWWAPIVPISAKVGTGVTSLLDYILEIEGNRMRKIAPDILKEFFAAKLKQRQPQRIRDEREPKIYSIDQVKSNPPIFLMKVNEPSAISMQFRKFLENAIIKELGFWGTPIQLKLEPKRGNPNTETLIKGKPNVKKIQAYAKWITKNIIPMHIIIGLGNPGEKYIYTRHNAGFLAVDYLADCSNITIVSTKEQFSSIIKEGKITDEINQIEHKALFVYPQTYMNESGTAVKAILDFYKLPIASIIVLHDEIDLPLGTIRFTENSSPAGHNGVKSIIEHLGTQEFKRIRIGIETRTDRTQPPTEAFVLQKFNENELTKIPFVEIAKKIDSIVASL